MLGAVRWLLIVALASCGRDEAPAEEPPSGSAEDDESVDEGEPRYQTIDPNLSGGPLVQLGRVTMSADQLVSFGEECAETFVVVEDGRLNVATAGGLLTWEAGTAHRFGNDRELRSDHGTTSLFLARVTGEDEGACAVDARDVVIDEVPELPFAGGKLKVRILFDEQSGSRFGALSILDADPELSVPPHVHEGSAEVLQVLSGAGWMVMGEQRLDATVDPGASYGVRDVRFYVPANTEHAYEARGERRLRAYQIYAPAGPEQRFRRPPMPDAPRAPTGAE